MTAAGGIRSESVIELLLDVVGDPSPSVRAAAIRSLAQIDQENFITVLSGLDPDPHWSVRSALASVLGTLPAEIGLPRLQAMRDDADERVIPAVLTALTEGTLSRRNVSIRSSELVDYPIAAGFARPMIILPAHLIRAMQPVDLDAIRQTVINAGFTPVRVERIADEKYGGPTPGPSHSHHSGSEYGVCHGPAFLCGAAG